MSVEEDVNIRLLDPRKLDEQGRKAVAEMEKIRKRLEKEAKEATKAIEKVQGAPADIAQAGSDIDKAIAKIPLGREAELREQRRISPIGIIPGPLARGQAPAGRKDAFRELRERVDGLETSDELFDKRLDVATEALGEVEGLVANPIAFFITKVRGVVPSLLLKGGLIGTIVIAVASQIFQMVKDTFKPGGINDIRKMVLDEAKTIPDIDNLVAIKNGSVFFFVRY